MIKSTILALILALCWRLQCCYGDTIQMYYDGYLRVNGVNRGLIKTFSLKNAFNTAAAVSLAIHYEQDLIFIADYVKLVRIHLVNENGTRIVSGNGELFVNATARYREEYIKTLDPKHCQTGLIFTRSNINGLYVDTVGNKLYIACKSLLEMNFDGSDERIAFVFDSSIGGPCEPIIYNGKFYFGANNYYGTGIYTATLNPNKTVTTASRLTPASGVPSISLLKGTSKLYYIDEGKDEIKVIDLNETFSRPKVVLRWSSYNNLLRTLAVSGEYLFWTERTFSAVWDQYHWEIHGGRVRNSVITSNNTWQIKFHRGRRYAIYQLAAFEHSFPPRTNPPKNQTFAPLYTTPGSIASFPTFVSWKIMLSVLVLASVINV